MYLPDRNKLQRPNALIVVPFEERLSRFKAVAVEYVRQSDPVLADELAITFENEAEVITKLIEVFTVILQNRDRAENEKACQMFAALADDNEMIDVIVSALGVVRQVMDPGDPNAFPAVPPTMESNDSVLTRYFLAVHALASTGTAKGYQFHAMTLGGKPTMSIDSPDENTVVVTYKFSPNDNAGKVKDARSVFVSEGVVDVFVLAHGGNGVPSSDLLQAVTQYLKRDDIGQETDNLTVKAAKIKPYKIKAEVTISQGPDSALTQDAADKAMAKYADLQHRLEGAIERSMIYYELHSIGAKHIKIAEPLDDIAGDQSTAPFCTEIEITVVTE